MAAAHACSSTAASEAPTTGEHRMGTTIVEVYYEGSVILGADSRTSTGTGMRCISPLFKQWLHNLQLEKAILTYGRTELSPESSSR